MEQIEEIENCLRLMKLHCKNLNSKNKEFHIAMMRADLCIIEVELQKLEQNGTKR